jgi:hypothetical protein
VFPKLAYFFDSAISEEEKVEIRRGLLQCFSEPSYPVALQIAVVVGKAARSASFCCRFVPLQIVSLNRVTDLGQHYFFIDKNIPI